jgi:hypothetical protein
MPVLKKQARELLSNSSKSLLLVSMLVAGCAGQADDPLFELEQAETSWKNGQLNVTIHQKITLSGEAKKALVHGVPLTLQMELEIRQTGKRAPVEKDIFSFEIRYLPLINNYQLTREGASEIRTFPRLRHLLAELSTVQQSFNRDHLPRGNYELLARTRLDQKKMPPPMRLPMLFSAQWRHDSHWKEWPVSSENGS